jgi:anti-sigma B factor antagonist
MSLLTIVVAAGDGGPLVALLGEADVTTVPELTAALTAQVAAGVRHLTVDLSGLRFADSASVSVFISASHVLRASGGTLVLCRPQPPVARMLSLLGVDQVIPVHGEAPLVRGPQRLASPCPRGTAARSPAHLGRGAGIDHPAGGDAEVHCPRGAVALPGQLAGRVRVGVDGEQAAGLGG